MPEAMTKERLEELQEMAAESIGFDIEGSYGEALSEACSEIERLQAERVETMYLLEDAAEALGWRHDNYPKTKAELIVAIRAITTPWEEGE